MEKEILNAIVEMVKQGGQLAVWGVFVYLFMQIVKAGTIGGITWLIVKTLCQTLSRCWELAQDRRKEAITLLSSDLQTKLLASLTEFQGSTTTILQDLENRLKGLSITLEIMAKSKKSSSGK